MRRAALALVCAALLLLLCGCGSLFEKEYVAISEYSPPTAAENNAEERITVRSMNELKKALISMVYDGSAGGSIAFDPNYEGNPPEDMESACWQVRTQDALCAYCVRDMSYKVEKIVNYYESSVSIDYTSYAAELSSIVQLPYAVGLQDYLSTAMEESRSRLTILVNASSYSVENVRSLAQDIYRKNPTICVREPRLSVNMYSGAGRQRLYEINFGYGLAEDEVIRCKAQLKNLDVMRNLNAYALDDVHRAFAACRYLVSNTAYSENAPASCYDALILGETNSEGLALAYVELCHQMELDCRIVYGQYGGVNHCWNIIRLDGAYYHIDVSRCYDEQFEDGFLRSDESMWNDYRWSISSYPACAGELSYADTIGAEASPESEQEETAEAPEAEEEESQSENTEI